MECLLQLATLIELENTWSLILLSFVRIVYDLVINSSLIKYNLPYIIVAYARNALSTSVF